MESSTPGQILRSLGPLPVTSARTPRTSEKSLQELFQSGDWLENSLINFLRSSVDIAAISDGCDFKSLYSGLDLKSLAIWASKSQSYF